MADDRDVQDKINERGNYPRYFSFGSMAWVAIVILALAFLALYFWIL